MKDLTETIRKYAEEFFATGDGSHFLVAIEKGKDGKRYAVIIDGDNGVSIDYCALLSRHISKRIDEEVSDGVGAFTFEVASPGVERPLILQRQYAKHIGRSIKFETAEGNTIKGALKAVNGNEITVDVETKESGKNKVNRHEQVFEITEIKEPKIIVSFK